MNELHLFVGIGGGVLGGMLLGHKTVCAVEIEPYCREVLLRRQREGILPRFPIWSDVRTFDGKPWKGRVDVVCGGFPCQESAARTRRRSGSKGNAAASGAKWRASSGKSSPSTSLRKTRRCSSRGALSASSETLTQWAIRPSASNSALKVSAKRYESGFGFWGSVIASKTAHGMSPKAILNAKFNSTINSLNRRFLESFGHVHQPDFAEWVMEFPIGWSALRALGTRCKHMRRRTPPCG